MVVFVSELKKEGFLDNIHFTIAIVGSRKMRNDDDYGDGIWQYFAPNLTIYGFDADEDACNIANQQLKEKGINWQEKHFPIALSDTVGECILYVTKGVDCTSLYVPNESYLSRFSVLNNHIKLDFSIEIETTTLDDFCQEKNIQNIDFLYLDIQGAELNVLQGAKNILSRSILGIQLEVEFASLYQKQPLFSDVDRALKNEQFSLFDLMTDHPMCRRPRSISPIYSSKKIGQLLWADALYLRDPLLENTPSFCQNYEQILKLACIADILEYPDYAVELFVYLAQKFPGNLDKTIKKILGHF
ncbi:FkbM family methyltransferase [Geminocystis sp. NIES-3709]|uniref:FkbM family methyltransferase n=1 Tax=Geminocystis sp. NIES-3709 TaxID=1617448 RepID=UPI0005FCCCC1|nr:FkbM family methyltransferase [Geminocystis sp. NIES-3709]BAQ64275.1 hypothetical protein GM3709_1040 [Geminocystis sp. NIES-3709]